MKPLHYLPQTAKFAFSSLILLLLLTIPSFTDAQEEVALKPRWMYPGCIISLQNDTLKGYIEFMTPLANQMMVRFYTEPSENRPSGKYKPDDIKGYLVESLYYESVPFSGEGVSRKNSFMIKILDGPVSLYKWYYDPDLAFGGQDLNEAMGTENVMDVDLYEGLETQVFGVKKGEKPVDFYSMKYVMKFKKNMSEFVAADTELAGKIENKEPGYTHDYLVRIIQEYNAFLQSKK